MMKKCQDLVCAFSLTGKCTRQGGSLVIPANSCFLGRVPPPWPASLILLTGIFSSLMSPFLWLFLGLSLASKLWLLPRTRSQPAALSMLCSLTLTNPMAPTTSYTRSSRLLHLHHGLSLSKANGQTRISNDKGHLHL